MNFCERCGAETIEGALFCTECGAPLTQPFDQNKKYNNNPFEEMDKVRPTMSPLVFDDTEIDAEKYAGIDGEEYSFSGGLDGETAASTNSQGQWNSQQSSQPNWESQQNAQPGWNNQQSAQPGWNNQQEQPWRDQNGQPYYGAYGNGYYPQSQPGQKSKIAAGLLGILLGGLGIHKFYLGYTSTGLIMLLVTLLTFGIGGVVMSIIGLVEGIIYLTKSDQEFYETYEVYTKKWF